ncbi:TVP38/TMEM64 family protein [Roseomonas sp. CCTCC AB2023176]|uniref:TVP38/TMEM64 family protein n=1 Tax=Roseomonas sp. CCTCC AB2023176 TaxID=3342640 RepID=UPI0035E25354
MTAATPSGAGPSGLRAALRLGVMAVGLALAGWIVRTLGVAPGTDTGMAWVDTFIRGQGLWGEAIFVAIGGAATAAGLPRQAVAFLGGYAFGAGEGIAWSLLAQLLGCAASFAWARLVGRAWAERRLQGRFGRRLRPLRDRLARNTFGATLAIRLLPVGNNLALNLLAGIGGIRLAPYLAASAIGYLPQTLVFALLGDGVAVDRTAQLVLGGALFVVSVILGLWLLRRGAAEDDPSPLQQP